MAKEEEKTKAEKKPMTHLEYIAKKDAAYRKRVAEAKK